MYNNSTINFSRIDFARRHAAYCAYAMNYARMHPVQAFNFAEEKATGDAAANAGFWEKVKAMPGQAGEFLGNKWNDASDYVLGKWNDASDYVSGKWKDASKYASGRWGDFTQDVDHFRRDARQLGKDVSSVLHDRAILSKNLGRNLGIGAGSGAALGAALAAARGVKGTRGRRAALGALYGALGGAALSGLGTMAANAIPAFNKLRADRAAPEMQSAPVNQQVLSDPYGEDYEDFTENRMAFSRRY